MSVHIVIILQPNHNLIFISQFNFYFQQISIYINANGDVNRLTFPFNIRINITFISFACQMHFFLPMTQADIQKRRTNTKKILQTFSIYFHDMLAINVQRIRLECLPKTDEYPSVYGMQCVVYFMKINYKLRVIELIL